jgi:hypothetical protein
MASTGRATPDSLAGGARPSSRAGSGRVSRAGSGRASRAGSAAGSRRGSSAGSRRDSIASVASSVRSSIDSFAMSAVGIGAEDRELMAQEQETSAPPRLATAQLPRPVPCRPGPARSNLHRIASQRARLTAVRVRPAVPAGDSPICSDMVLQMLLYFHVYFSLVWFAMYWYLWTWKVRLALAAAAARASKH